MSEKDMQIKEVERQMMAIKDYVKEMVDHFSSS
jgi:hypothetical protein